MVTKPVNGSSMWLFPSSFQYICDQQQSSGGWEGGDVIDEIVNTLACLLSLRYHAKAKCETSKLSERMDRAIAFLNGRLLNWDVKNTERLAFEILVPSMLNLLEREDIVFRFPNRDALLQLREQKMSKFSISQLYKYPSPMLYSLEAFIGIIDFDKVKHHLSDGSMFCSPSSTAAYLMNISEWDERAEMYLTDALRNGNGNGAVASVYPTGAFEFAWV